MYLCIWDEEAAYIAFPNVNMAYLIISSQCNDMKCNDMLIEAYTHTSVRRQICTTA